MTPIEKLIETLKEMATDPYRIKPRKREEAVREYESEPKPLELPVELETSNIKDGYWFTLDPEGNGEINIEEPNTSDEFGGMWVGPGWFVGVFPIPEDWKTARWHLEDGKWVTK
jgi:hypothetical protein